MENGTQDCFRKVILSCAIPCAVFLFGNRYRAPSTSVVTVGDRLKITKYGSASITAHRVDSNNEPTSAPETWTIAN